MYHVSAQGIDKCMINVHYYYKARCRVMIIMNIICLSIQCVVARSGTAYIACYFVNRKARR